MSKNKTVENIKDTEENLDITNQVTDTEVENTTGVVVNCQKLRVRKSPVKNQHNIVGVVLRGTAFEIIGDKGEWYKVRNDNIEGYVCKEYIAIKEEV